MLAGALSIVSGIVTARHLMAAGAARMPEISAAVRAAQDATKSLAGGH